MMPPSPAPHASAAALRPLSEPAYERRVQRDDIGYRTTDLKATRRAPFRIAEDDAVRLGLLFAALKPLRKYLRIEEVAGAISSMEREELYYWFSKVTTGSEQGQVQRALRIRVSDE